MVAAITAVVVLAGVIAVSVMQQPGHCRACSLPDVPPSGIQVQFVGDWGRGGVVEQTSVAAAMRCDASRWSAKGIDTEATVSTGDQFYDNGVSSASDPQWASSWSGVYPRGALSGVPFIGCLGNHDLRGSVEAQTSLAANAVAEWRMPGRYFSHRACMTGSPGRRAALSARGPGGAMRGTATANDTARGCVCVAVVDTTPLLRSMRERPGDEWAVLRANCASLDRPAMLSWLANTTAEFQRLGCARSVVVGHHPIVSGGEHGNHSEVAAALMPAMEGKVDAYVSGHDHMQQVSTIPSPAGAPVQVVTGAGSTTRPDSTFPAPSSLWTSSRSGFAALTLTRIGGGWDRGDFNATMRLTEVPVPFSAASGSECPSGGFRFSVPRL